MEIRAVIKLLKESLEELRSDSSVKQFSGGTFSTWKWKVRSILINGLAENAWLIVKQWDTATIALPLPDTTIYPGWQKYIFEQNFERKLPNVEATLQNMIWQLETFGAPYVSSGDESIKPKAFIAHGPKSQALDKLYRYLSAQGIEPLIIEQEPYESRAVNEQVELYLEQADCAIILGTADDNELKDGKLYPRRNVYIEIGRCQERFPNRTIYLLEENASFPSNIEEKLRTHFTSGCMDEALIRVSIELTAFRILKAVKPQEEEKNTCQNHLKS